MFIFDIDGVKLLSLYELDALLRMVYTNQDWSVPASVRITDGSMESLLSQLLDMQPRKRGTARGILNLHPFFRTKSATSMGPSTIGAADRNNIALKEETGTIVWNAVGTAEQTIADSMTSASLPTNVTAIETNRSGTLCVIQRYYNLYFLLILLFTPLLFNTIIKFHSPFTPYGTLFILFKLLQNLCIQTTDMCIA